MTKVADTNFMGFIFLVVVLVFCGLGIRNAILQHNERIAWEGYVNKGLANLATGENTLTTQMKDIEDWKKSRDFITKDEATNLFTSLKTSQPQNDFRPLAGCYGVIPTNSSQFNLTCDKNFWN